MSEREWLTWSREVLAEGQRSERMGGEVIKIPPGMTWEEQCDAMSLSELRGIVSDGIRRLPALVESSDVMDRVAAAMVAVAVITLADRFEGEKS